MFVLKTLFISSNTYANNSFTQTCHSVMLLTSPSPFPHDILSLPSTPRSHPHPHPLNPPLPRHLFPPSFPRRPRRLPIQIHLTPRRSRHSRIHSLPNPRVVHRSEKL
jgi:hypothetical protein